MPTRPRTPSSGLDALRAAADPDDGADPRVFFRKPGPRGKPDRKARQLCRQVLEALDGLLAAHPGDPRDPDGPAPRDLVVLAVEPAPDASRLLVTLAPRCGIGPAAIAILPAQLDRAAPALRAGVARAVRRRRAPLLAYRIIPGPGPLPPAA